MGRFPALYRMPVFYLATAAVLSAVAAIGPSTPRRVPVVVTDVVPRPDRPPPPTIPPPKVEPILGPTDPILRTASGVRRKVLIPGREVFTRETPDGEADPARLEPLSIRFVLDETPSQLRVGTADGRPDGWVARSTVVEWETRLIARPTPRTTRPGVEIYADRDCLVSTWSGSACPRHKGRCPKEVEESDPAYPGAGAGWPILGIGSVPGDGRTIYEVAPLMLESSPTEAERFAPLRPALRQVYVAFAIDTTASMRPTIEAARSLAKGFADEVTRRYGDISLHLGLVEYRDDAPGLGFKARVATPFTGPAGFRVVIDSLEAARHEDDSASESVLDGVALAIPGTPGGLEWPGGRAGDLATKLVVLVGDSPDHAVDLARAEGLAGRARSAGITIATVRLDPPPRLSEADRARLDGQWHTLAASSYRPPDPSSGFARPIEPLAVRLGPADRLTASLRTLVDDRVERAREMARLAAAEDEGRLAEYCADRRLSMVQVAPILDAMRRGGPAPRRTRRKVPSIHRGWLADRVGDTRFVTVEALVSRDEIDQVVAELAAIDRSPIPRPTLPLVNAIGLGELSFLDVDRTRLTPDETARRRSALPASRPAADRVRPALAEWSRLKSMPDLFDPGRTVGIYAAIPIDRLDF